MLTSLPMDVVGFEKIDIVNGPVGEVMAFEIALGTFDVVQVGAHAFSNLAIV
jgi:hypothetical protein